MLLLKSIWNRLELRLILLVLLLVIVPLLSVGWLALESSRRTLQQQIFDHLAAVAVLKADEIDRWVDLNRDHLYALAQRPLVGGYAEQLTSTETADPIRQQANDALLANHFQPILNINDNFTDLFLLDAATGEIIAATNPADVGKFRASETYFRAGREATTVQDIYYSMTTAQPMMTIGTPVGNPEGAVVAVLAAHLDLTKLTEITEKTDSLTASGDTYLVNQFNFFITNPRFGDDFALRQTIFTTGTTRCLQGMSGQGVYEDYRGMAVLGVYRWLPQRNLCLLSELDQTEALVAIQTLLRFLLISSLLIALGAIVAGVFFTRTITVPLKRLTRGIRYIGRGNLDYEIPVQHQDDIGRLTASFNQMTQDLRQLVGQTVHDQQTLLALSEIAQAAQQAHTPAVVYEIIGGRIAKLDYHVSILLLTEDRQHLRVGYMSFDAAVIRLAEQLTGLSAAVYEFPLREGTHFERALQSRKPIFITSMDEFVAAALPTRLRFMSDKIAAMLEMRRGIVAPLIVNNEVLGVLTVMGDQLADTMVTTMAAFANQAAIALQNARLITRLQQQETRYRLALQGAQLGTWTKDLVSGEVFWDQRAREIFGVGPAEPITLNRNMALIHPADREQVQAVLDEAADPAHGDSSYHVEKRIQLPDGALRWVMSQGQVLFANGENGHYATKIVGVVRDVTERKQAEAELNVHRYHLEKLVAARTVDLRRSEARFRSLFETVPVAVIVTGMQEAPILAANQQAAEVLAIDRERLIGRSVSDLILDATAWDKLIAELRTQREIHNKEMLIQRPDGQKIWVMLSIVVDQHEGEKALLIGFQDITVQKQLELELQRSNEELQQFAYVASHDLQEPLRMVTSYLQLLEHRYQSQLDQDAHEFIEYAVDGAKRMRILINDLLTFSRVGTRGKPFATVEMAAIFSRVQADLGLSLEETSAVLTHDPLPTVWADGSQVQQLLQNLISNALKFRGDARPEIHIGVARQEGRWRFSVQDNGIGFDPQFAERIFVIFQRLHTRDQYTGTGIGLAICKKIVDRHNGQIWVESEIGVGSTFYFTLPAVELDESE